LHKGKEAIRLFGVPIKRERGLLVSPTQDKGKKVCIQAYPPTI